MVVEYIRYRVGEDRRKTFEAAYKEAHPALTASPHCLACEVSRCVEEPGRYVVRIEWDSLEGHMEGFRKGPQFPAFFELVRPFVRDIEEMQHYEVVASGGG